MIKKIMLIFVLIFSFFIGNNVFSVLEPEGEGYNPIPFTPPSGGGNPGGFVGEKSNTTDHNSSKYFNNDLRENTFTRDNLDALRGADLVDKDGNLTDKGRKIAGDDASQCGPKCVEKLNNAAAESAAAKGGPAGGECTEGICSSSYVVPTNTFTIIPSGSGSAKQKINATLGKIIKSLMIALGVISLLIMTIGTGYMILYHGEDEYLTKGKNIFIGGMVSLIVSLSAYYLVNFVGYILYS